MILDHKTIFFAFVYMFCSQVFEVMSSYSHCKRLNTHFYILSKSKTVYNRRSVRPAQCIDVVLDFRLF